MKNSSISNAERYRRERQQQVKDRRQQILSIARELFLANGIENTTMQEIADAANISKMTLYRYFPDRASVAVDVAITALHAIREHTRSRIQLDPVNDVRFENLFTATIDTYPEVVEEYRFIAMFDNLYYANYPTPELQERYTAAVQNIFDHALDKLIADQAGPTKYAHIITITNMIAGFLQRLALRGELMTKEQHLPMDVQLALFREYIHSIVIATELDT